MNKVSRKPAHTVAELESARQQQENPADQSGNFTFFSRPRGGGKPKKKNRAAREIVAARHEI